MELFALGRILLLIWCTFSRTAYSQSDASIPSTLLGGIGNVASSATNFLANAVEGPRNLLFNATRATTGIIDSAASKGLEFKLRKFLEKFRGRMYYGIPQLGIPVLEPFRLDEIDIDTDNPEIGNLSLVIQDLEVHRLSTFVVDRAKLSLIGPTISVNITVPQIYAEGHYNISGIVGDMFPLYGAGSFHATIYQFRLYANVVLGYSRGMYIKKLDLDFTLDSINIKLENFMGGDDIGRLMNQVFQDLTPEAVDIIKPEILPVIQDYIGGRANDTIGHLTMRDLLGVILGENEVGEFIPIVIP